MEVTRAGQQEIRVAVLCSQERSRSACMRKIRLPHFAKELKRRKLSSIVRKNGGMRARTRRVVTPFQRVWRDLFSISLEAL